MDKDNFTLNLYDEWSENMLNHRFVMDRGQLYIVVDGSPVEIEEEASPEMYCLVRTLARTQGVF